MKHIVAKLIPALFLIPSLLLAQDNISQSTGIIGNGRLLGAKTYDGQTTVGILGIDSSGNTTIQSLSGKAVTIPGALSVTTSLLPATDNAVDIGSDTLTYRTLYTGTSRIAKTSDILRVRQDAQRLFTWDASSDTAYTFTFGDGGTTATQILGILASTADSDDDSGIQINGGGANSSTRGSGIKLWGNENAGSDGALEIFGGADSGSSIYIDINNVSAALAIRNTSDATMWSFSDAGILKNGSAGSDLALSTTGTTIAIQEATAASACSGTLTANGATPVVVSTTCARTGSRIFLARTSAETGTVSAWRSALTNATSFAVTSEAADTGTYDWFIIHEAA